MHKLEFSITKIIIFFACYIWSAWNSSGNSINDPNAFLFSLRRARVSFKDEFIIKQTEYALSRDFESREESFGDLMRSFERRNNKGSLGISFINLMRSLEDFQFNFGSKIPLDLQILFVRDSKDI